MDLRFGQRIASTLVTAVVMSVATAVDAAPDAPLPTLVRLVVPYDGLRAKYNPDNGPNARNQQLLDTQIVNLPPGYQYGTAGGGAIGAMYASLLAQDAGRRSAARAHQAAEPMRRSFETRDFPAQVLAAMQAAAAATPERPEVVLATPVERAERDAFLAAEQAGGRQRVVFLSIIPFVAADGTYVGVHAVLTPFHRQDGRSRGGHSFRAGDEQVLEFASPVLPLPDKSAELKARLRSAIPERFPVAGLSGRELRFALQSRELAQFRSTQTPWGGEEAIWHLAPIWVAEEGKLLHEGIDLALEQAVPQLVRRVGTP